MRIRKSGLIKRYSYPLCKRSLIVNTPTPDNPFGNTTTEFLFERGVAEVCTIQSPNYTTIKTMPEGIDLSQTYTIYTNTNLVPAIENSNILADAIYLPACYFGDSLPEQYGGWFTVMQVKPRASDVINHTEAVITRDKYILNEDGISQYPDTTNLIASIPDRASLQSGAWASGWISENT